MSVAEMKLAAINEIGKLKNESAVKEILEHLAKISQADDRLFDTEAFFSRVSDKYDDILQKLAQ